jgi:hypothetical protein
MCRITCKIAAGSVLSQYDQFRKCCRQVFLQSIELFNKRYKGPPVKPIKAKSDGSQTPVNPSPDPLLPSQFQKPKKPTKLKAPHHHKRPSKASSDYGTYDAFYKDWDLIPPPSDKAFPNWDKYKSVPDSFHRYSQKSLKDLMRHSVVDNSPTVPSPHDLAIINTVRKKLDTWEKAEEDMFRRQRGWYCNSKIVEDRAYSSWALTQNRPFGSAVWRWLRLDNWDKVQTPRMKGLYAFPLTR